MNAAAAAAGGQGSRSLWIGEIEPWMDESFLTSIFSNAST